MYSSSHYLRIVPSWECWSFRHDWSTETCQSLISPMSARWTQNEKIFVALWYSLCLSLSVHLCLFSLLSSFFICNSSSIHSTILTYNAELIAMTQTWNTPVWNDRQTLCVCVCVCVHVRFFFNCLCGMLMSIRDGQRWGVSGIVSVKSEVSHIHSQWSVPAELLTLVARRPPCWKIGDGTILKYIHSHVGEILLLRNLRVIYLESLVTVVWDSLLYVAAL